MPSQDHVISYQLHSRNDLREWNSLLRKGATSLKVDPHYISGYDKFILTHDTPTADQLEQLPYSTLDDVLEYFESPPDYAHGRAIDIALCFKSAPGGRCDDDPSSEAVQWMEMADAFFAAVARLVPVLKEKFDIELTLVLDGGAKPCGCLQDKFTPWPSVWIVRDQCSLECYSSNEGYCQRYSILNNPYNVSDWTNMSQHHYGKFGGVSNQTLQVWEPDAQSEILELIDVYNDARSKGVPSGSGLAFAINVDVSMFQAFSARSLQGSDDAQGFSWVLDEEEDTTLQNATMPILVKDGKGDILLQYTVTNGLIRERFVALTPFTNIQVGPPVDVGYDTELAGSTEEAEEKFETNLFEAFNRTIDSKSSIQAGQFSFQFLAVEGKVYASAKFNSGRFSSVRQIGLGTTVHASSLDDTLLLVTEGNYCYNSHVHNTQAAPLMCEPQHDVEQACPYAIDYSIGVAENWYHWLQQPAHTDAIITPCNEHLLHGTLTAGKNPSGALFAMPDGDKVGVLVAHEPYPLSEESPCGTPVLGEQGIILSSFATFVVQDRIRNHDFLMERKFFNENGGKMALLLIVVVAVLAWLFLRRRAPRSTDYESVQSNQSEQQLPSLD